MIDLTGGYTAHGQSGGGAVSGQRARVCTTDGSRIGADVVGIGAGIAAEMTGESLIE
jgi:hypothetical protein